MRREKWKRARLKEKKKGRGKGEKGGTWRFATNGRDTRLEGERHTRDVEYVWRMWRSLYTHPGSVMGAFRLLVCNIRNSCLPVCRLLPRARDVPIGAGETHTRTARRGVRCESGITCVLAEFEGEAQGRILQTFREIKLFCTTTKNSPVDPIYYH